MPKRKKSPKDSRSEQVVEPQTHEQSDPAPPSLPSSSALELHRAPALSRFIEAVRKAVGAALDLADAAADAVTKAVRKGA
jgi:hypothetical protein